MPPTKQRTPELRDRLLAAAVELVAAEGPEGLTTRRVAGAADTSAPAVYELFGDKAGLVREIFFEGFRRLADQVTRVQPSDDPRADLILLLGVFRRFATANPVLAQIMFGRPFPDFDPGPAEAQAGRAVRECLVGHVQRAIDAGVLAGDATDDAHVLFSLAQGLAAVEAAGWLGTSAASVNRRWRLGLDAVLDGLAPRP